MVVNGDMIKNFMIFKLIPCLQVPQLHFRKFLFEIVFRIIPVKEENNWLQGGQQSFRVFSWRSVVSLWVWCWNSPI